MGPYSLRTAVLISAASGVGVAGTAAVAINLTSSSARNHGGMHRAPGGWLSHLIQSRRERAAERAQRLTRKQARVVDSHVKSGEALETSCQPYDAAAEFEAALAVAGRADGDIRAVQLLLALAKQYSDASFAPGLTTTESHAAAARAVAITAALVDNNNLACGDVATSSASSSSRKAAPKGLGLGSLRLRALGGGGGGGGGGGDGGGENDGRRIGRKRRKQASSAWQAAGLGTPPAAEPGSVHGIATTVPISSPYDVSVLLGHSINLGRLAIFADNQAKARLAKDVRAYALAAIERHSQDGAANGREVEVDYAWHAYGRWQNEMASIGWPVKLAIRVLYGESFPEPGSHAKAEEAYAKAVDINPRRIVHRVEHGRTLAKLGRYEDAERTLVEAIGMGSDVGDINDQASLQEAHRIVAALRTRGKTRGRSHSTTDSLDLKTGLS